MASLGLDTDVEADCCEDTSEVDLDIVPSGYGTPAMMGIVPRQKKADSGPGFQKLGIKTRELSYKPVKTDSVKFLQNSYHPNLYPSTFPPQNTQPASPYIQATQDIRDDMIEDGAHVVFDWDNTLKLYNKQTRELSCRVSKQFLLHLKKDRGCKLYIISAVRPSAMNLDTVLCEVDRLGLRDIFVGNPGDQVDGMRAADTTVVKAGQYARKGNIIICGYDKAETFLKLSAYDSNKGHKVMFFDDEEVNIHNFSAMVPNSRCYLCE